jgi:hypothetical protein
VPLFLLFAVVFAVAVVSVVILERSEGSLYLPLLLQLLVSRRHPERSEGSPHLLLSLPWPLSVQRRHP